MKMKKEHILAEIRRVAAANGGKPPGRRIFFSATGINEADWRGIHWVRWSEALEEAALAPNKAPAAISQQELLIRLAALTKELGHFPLVAEFKIKVRSDPTFPSEKLFRPFGGKRSLMAKLGAFCAARGEDEVAALCEVESQDTDGESSSETIGTASVGYVYLVRHGSRREYKIGRTNNPLRREGEIRTELPEQLSPVHQITTDDPSGVERYWHVRFAEKRKNGEWFALAPEDIRAFKRWRRIY